MNLPHLPERLPWYPWYTGEWLAETRGWSLLERGLYRELLDAQWDRETLPASLSELRVLVAVTTAEWKQAWPRIAHHFPRVIGGRKNARLATLKLEQEALRERRRSGAAHTNRKRWASPTESLSDSASDLPSGRRPSAARPNANSSEDSPQQERYNQDWDGVRQ